MGENVQNNTQVAHKKAVHPSAGASKRCCVNKLIGSARVRHPQRLFYFLCKANSIFLASHQNMSIVVGVNCHNMSVLNHLAVYQTRVLVAAASRIVVPAARKHRLLPNVSRDGFFIYLVILCNLRHLRRVRITLRWRSEHANEILYRSRCVCTVVSSRHSQSEQLSI